MLAPQAEFVNFVFLCESAQKCIISHKIPQKFSEGGHSPFPSTEPPALGRGPRPYPVGIYDASTLHLCHLRLSTSMADLL